MTVFSCCKPEISEVSTYMWTVKEKESRGAGGRKEEGRVKNHHVWNHPQAVSVLKAWSSSVLGRINQSLESSMHIQCLLEWDLYWLKKFGLWDYISKCIFLLGDCNCWSQIQQYFGLDPRTGFDLHTHKDHFTLLRQVTSFWTRCKSYS